MLSPTDSIQCCGVRLVRGVKWLRQARCPRRSRTSSRFEYECLRPTMTRDLLVRSRGGVMARKRPRDRSCLVVPGVAAGGYAGTGTGVMEFPGPMSGQPFWKGRFSNRCSRNT